MYSEKNIAFYKVQNLQGEVNEITDKLNITIIKKEEDKEKIHKLKSVLSENSSILDNKCLENVETLRGKDELEGEFKCRTIRSRVVLG